MKVAVTQNHLQARYMENRVKLLIYKLNTKIPWTTFDISIFG